MRLGHLQHNWIWCVAATSKHLGCSNDDGDGLVAGIWESDINYCARQVHPMKQAVPDRCHHPGLSSLAVSLWQVGSISFWIREEDHYPGSSPGTALASCAAIKEAFPEALDGRYFIKPEAASPAFPAYCDMTTR